MIFDLPVYIEAGEENWSNAELFSDKPQGFAKTGVRTDNDLRPVDENDQLVYENVYVVGNSLGGYDFCFEHSGNGVALASAYKAAKA
jgi:glycerol-3-phosphate dehydrogenase subunit B